MSRRSRQAAALARAVTRLTADRSRHQTRIDRLARALWATRRALAAQERVNNQLSNQLFSAMGYTDAALTRLDVPARTAAGREPGEVTS
ncbi:hypothetical protein [Streptomyces lydicus]|uniref:hypothetical protein n=1 Tax=Streptomyces lydicus TaxID=47763 RepID=UPI001012ABB3|nr:hypothetical protein [Streptomyces lydicus]MCZ1006378.1 hypothetical protein [Streptomyces lydicus]